MRYLLTQSEFDQLLNDCKNKLVVVEFGATWCGPCRLLEPKLQEMDECKEFKDKVVFAKVDVDEAEDLTADMDIKCMPTIFFYRNKKKVDEMSGCNKNVLDELIQKHL